MAVRRNDHKFAVHTNRRPLHQHVKVIIIEDPFRKYYYVVCNKQTNLIIMQINSILWIVIDVS